MKKFSLFIGLCILFTGFCIFPSNAQELPTNFLVMEEFVSPSDMQNFTKAQDKALELMKNYPTQFTFWTYRTDENSLYWVLPFEKFASLDVMFADMNGLRQKMLEDGFDPDKEFRNLSTMRHTLIHWSQDLSFHPTGKLGQSKENPYCEWTFAYLKAGHEQEAAEAIKKYQEFYTKNDQVYEWDVYQVIFGHDMPCWILMTRSESELALRKTEAELSEKYMQEFQKMWQNFAQHVRKFENRKGWFIPRWSMNWEME